MKHIVSFSGGKDSAAMLVRMIEDGMTVDEIVFCNVMATPTSGAEFPEVYEYIKTIESHIGRSITIVNSVISFEEQFYRVKKRGNRVGQIYGWPHTIGAWCNGALKMPAIDKTFKSFGEHIRYLGIAHDEPKRLARLKPGCVAPLDDWKMTEQDCVDFLDERELMNPLYKKFRRLGCWFCPKQNLGSLRVLHNEYPELWGTMMNWDKDSPHQFRPSHTLQELSDRFRKEPNG